MRKVIVVLLMAAMVACTNIDCPVQNLVYTNYALKKAGGEVNDTLGNDTLWIKTLRANHTDTLLINSLNGEVSSFSLHISYTQPEDIFVTLLSCKNGHQYIDTIRVKKTNIPHFESVDCQAAYFHNIEDVSTTHNAFDSITIHQPYVSYDITQTHFYVYLKAQR